MKKKYRQNAIQTKALLVAILSLMTVCTYQVTKIANSLQQLELKFDLFEVVDKLMN
jgi:methanogenic corrinoid protein MtbC1